MSLKRAMTCSGFLVPRLLNISSQREEPPRLVDHQHAQRSQQRGGATFGTGRRTGENNDGCEYVLFDREQVLYSLLKPSLIPCQGELPRS
jgi:hypothetical protein